MDILTKAYIQTFGRGESLGDACAVGILSILVEVIQILLMKLGSETSQYQFVKNKNDSVSSGERNSNRLKFMSKNQKLIWNY